MTKIIWLKETGCEMASFTTISRSNIYKEQGNNWGNQCDFAVTVIPKVYELNNKCSIQIINQLPTIPLPIPSLPWSKYESISTTHTLPKIPLSGGEEISLGDLTIPPNTDWKFETSKREPKKTTLSIPSNQLEENLDKIMTKNSSLINDRMESKIIPFKYVEK